jgi:hypothetical protein
MKAFRIPPTWAMLFLTSCMVLTISPARADDLDRDHRPGFFQRLFGRPAPAPRPHLRRVERTYTVVYPDGRRVRYTYPAYTEVYPADSTTTAVTQNEPATETDAQGLQHLEVPVNSAPAPGGVLASPKTSSYSNSRAAGQQSADNNFLEKRPVYRPDYSQMQPSPRVAYQNPSTVTPSREVKPKKSTPAKKSSGANLTSSGTTEYLDQDDNATSKHEATNPGGQKLADLPANKSDKGNASAARQPEKNFPMGTRSNKAGFVKSPYAPHNELDATGLSSGSLAKDPTTGKIFRVP